MSAKPTGLIENGDNVARSHRKLYDWQRSGFATMSGTLGIRDRTYTFTKLALRSPRDFVGTPWSS